MTAPKKKGPAYKAKNGNVSVPVYRYSDSRFVVVWRQFAGAPRTRESFETKKAATDRADELALALANSQADVVTLTSADRDHYRLAVQKLAPLGISLSSAVDQFVLASQKLVSLGIPLLPAVEEFVAARQLIPGHTTVEATTFFFRERLERTPCPPAAEVLAGFLGRLRDDRRDEANYIRPLERDLVHFTTAHPDLSTIDEETVRNYLRGLVTKRCRKNPATGEIIAAGAPIGARRRDNIRDAIVSLFFYAKDKGYLAKNVAEGIAHVDEGTDVTTKTPGQIRAILEYLLAEDPLWLPWAALAAFGGLRTSEIFRLRWEALRWREPTEENPTRGTIVISARVARKVREARRPPISTALAAWLLAWSPVLPTSGFVIPRSKFLAKDHSAALQRLVKALKWPGWESNSLRHSFGSHRLAIVQSYDQVALEMGNSPAKVQSNYNDPKSTDEAEAYFAVLPASPASNILAMPPARAGGGRDNR